MLDFEKQLHAFIQHKESVTISFSDAVHIRSWCKQKEHKYKEEHGKLDERICEEWRPLNLVHNLVIHLIVDFERILFHMARFMNEGISFCSVHN